MNRRYKYKSKFKKKHRWTRLKEIETDYSRGFGKLASLASSFSKFLFIRCIYVTIRVSPFAEQDQPGSLIGQCLHLIRTSQGVIW